MLGAAGLRQQVTGVCICATPNTANKSVQCFQLVFESQPSMRVLPFLFGLEGSDSTGHEVV